MRNILFGLLFIFFTGCVGDQKNMLTAAEVQKICLDKKRAAEGPTGFLSLSTGTKGTKAGAALNFHSDFLMGKDPNSVFLDCMFQMNSKIKNI